MPRSVTSWATVCFSSARICAAISVPLMMRAMAAIITAVRNGCIWPCASVAGCIHVFRALALLVIFSTVLRQQMTKL
jgi:hypothetical protein